MFLELFYIYLMRKTPIVLSVYYYYLFIFSEETYISSSVQLLPQSALSKVFHIRNMEVNCHCCRSKALKNKSNDKTEKVILRVDGHL